MGVQGLWTVVQPCARPTQLATLNRKRLAVDASIWIYQFLKAVRDKEGNALRNSHVVGFFRRICKLLWFGIQPVFVFDGGAPALKRATLQNRRRRREGRREDAVRTAGKLLAVQMQRLAEEEAEQRKKAAETVVPGTVGAREAEDEEDLPDLENMVYVEELGTSREERQQNRFFRKEDPYHLPELQNGAGGAKPSDPRIMSVEELEEYARDFHEGEDINLYDFSKIDFDSEFFKSLPPADRYNILNAARVKSRLRMGYSKEQLEDMFPDRMAFSRFQIERATKRNHLTQRLMSELGMTGTDMTMGSRVAGEQNREYILVQNEGAEGGWALGVVSKEKDVGASHNPIDVDKLDVQFRGPDDEDDWEDELDFEDVPIEGLNRLPKPKRTRKMSFTRKQPHETIQQDALEDEESLFVNNNNHESLAENDDLEQDEANDLDKAIAMSLETQFRANNPNKELENEARPTLAPQWTQQSVDAAKPISSSRGSIIAHIVNSRASASISNPVVSKQQENDESSDSDMDFQSAVAAARKKLNEKVPVMPNINKPHMGPLPFEKLDWQSSLVSQAGLERRANGTSSKKHATEGDVATTGKALDVETGDLEAESDENAGGFEEEDEIRDFEAENAAASSHYDDGAPRPLPPWLADNIDIRESVREQKEQDRRVAAEDEELVRQEQLLFQQRREKEVIEIGSDGDVSDVEIIDAPMGRSRPTQPEPLREAAKLHTISITPERTGKPSPPESVPVSAEEQKAKESPEPASLTEARSEAPEIPTRASEVPSSPSDLEFEDVRLDEEFKPSAPSAYVTDQDRGVTTNGALFTDDMVEAARQLAAGPKYDVEESEPVDPNAPTLEEFDDFSDPEDEELLAQLAEEAEAHAQFASQLNKKTERENQEAYEKELKALRNQQKKDRRDADEVTQVMVTECQSLLRLFGLPYITAPMEAEAQCAELVLLGLVDGIVTDDSDVFLFGGTRVYKNMFNSNKLVECYLSSDLEKELSLTREHLIALAQLLGSDYTEGLPGVGPITAVEILSEFPGTDSLTLFKEWWSDVQHGNRPKEADADSPFRRKFRKAQAAKLFLPPGFPSPAVVDAYLRPEVDRNPEPFQWGVPDLEGLRRFLMATIGWGQERTDEVLVPVIRDMNKREQEGTQSNITRYFSGSVGAGAKQAFAPRQRAQVSRRLVNAVNKLKGNQENATDTVAGNPSSSKKKSRKRKAKEPIVLDDNEEENESAENDDQDFQDTAGADTEDNGETRPTRTRKGRASGTASEGKGKGKITTKRSKTSSD